MAPFDGPALAAAKVRINQINARGGVHGAAAADRHVRHEQQQPSEGEVVRCEPARKGRPRHLHDVRRRLRDAGRPGVAQGGQAGDRPVHRHRPDGAEALRQRRGRWRSASATSPRTKAPRWRSTPTGRAGGRRTSRRTRSSSTSRTSSRRSRSGSPSWAAGSARRESYATGANNVNAAVSRLNARKADVIVTSTAFGELPALVKGIRSLGNKTPILNSWAGDGTYWVAEQPAGDRLLRGHLRVRLRR